MIKKIEESEADASIARGYASLDVTATTSGQVTDLKLPNSQEEIYTSWIGDALGIGVQGGFSILLVTKKFFLIFLKVGSSIVRVLMRQLC